MNLLETIIVIIIVALIVTTAVTEPKLSFQYGKAMTGSAKKVYGVVKPIVVETIQMINTPNTNNNSVQVQK